MYPICTLFGTDCYGAPVYLITLKDESGITAEVISFGASLRALYIPGAGLPPADIVLGYDDLNGYKNDTAYLGATIGRTACRIPNAKFELLSNTYTLAKNDGKHHLHGGISGFNKHNWSHALLDDGVIFTRCSPHGEEGYPGSLTVSITYRLNDNALSIEYLAFSDRATVINLTNHSYFNLAGHNKKDILSQELMLNSDFYIPANKECIALGELFSVKGTPMDFTSFKQLGKDINADYPQLKQYGGYDHYYFIKGHGFREAAVVRDIKSGRSLKLKTDLPGLQLFTSNDTNVLGKNCTHYGSYSAFCLETQYPQSSLCNSYFKGPQLEPYTAWHSRTEYEFSW